MRVSSAKSTGAVVLLLSSHFFSTDVSAQAAAPQAPTAPTVTAPSVSSPAAGQPPTVLPAKGAPAASAPASPAQTAASVQAAPNVATRYEEASYKKMEAAGNVVVLFFSSANDAVWAKQAQAIQTILKEPEFGRIAAFQIDIGAYPAIGERFLVTSPGTILMMKSGFERIRSTRMVQADVIRKMIRLHVAL